MSIDRALLAAYLRQRAENGEKQVFLAELGRLEALALVSGRGAGAGETAVHARARAHARVSETAPPYGDAPEEVAAPGNVEAPEADARARVHVQSSSADADNRPATQALAALAAEIDACRACSVAGSCTNVVVGDGPADADVMVIGEAPGAEEDRTGVPFVGRAGKMLDLLLASIGFPRERVYICNVLKCRPPENRDPTPDEIAKCAPHLVKQIDIIRPRVILAVGRFSAQFLSGSDAPMARLRGRVHSYQGVPVVATYHPAYLLRSQNEVRKCWQDLQLLRQTVDAARS